jgi:hypothetical protein
MQQIAAMARAPKETIQARPQTPQEFSQEQHAVDRVATYMAKRSQGYVPEAALAETNLTHFNYANMTGFEREAMRRIIPFYNFARQNHLNSFVLPTV